MSYDVKQCLRGTKEKIFQTQKKLEATSESFVQGNKLPEKMYWNMHFI